MTATLERLQITEPGVYDIPAEAYHADPVPGGSLSSSGARLLMPPSCPAIFKHRMDNPEPYVKEFALGSAAHKLVLGAGDEFAVIDAADWRTKAARQEREEAQAAGLIPLLQHQFDQVEAMAQALREHPTASALFDSARGGRPEQALFWRDKLTGITRRALLDWLPAKVPGRRMILADYKTAASAEPTAIAKAVYNHGYHQQAAWYIDGVVELGLDEDPAFVFVFQEKEPPYLVTVIELDRVSLMWGDVLNRAALARYRHCVETGRWPGYADDVQLVSLPVWAQREYEAAESRGDYNPGGITR
ncbi:PD-(D/E)XK nuclease-like domain-containing protein [Amycolatopsis sp. NPDC006125]|uniref:PD-(D/E)XK nuclease-like domain-containing protein n=1 Tax=Amycolatopsis sp. NPDC006125 TaxID=3156730 RepID=UPI0033AEE288